MLADIVPFLRCPHCGEALSLGAGSLSCVRGHNFDVARQGYASLAPGGGGRPRGDTAAMVSEREAFLRAGHLAGLRDEIATIASSSIVTSPFSGEITARSPGGQACVVDAGAGTGYYLAGVLDRRADLVGIALDASKFALRRAARAHPRAAAVGCDVWGSLPVRDKCAALVLDVFAPRNGPEFRRILHPDGRVIVVTPDPNHLRELVARLGLIGVDSHKQRRLAAAFSSSFTLVKSRRYEHLLSLAETEIHGLVGMGPSAHHIDDDELRRRIAREFPELHLPGSTAPVTVSVLISVYRCR